jgi:hypothetical protein
MKIDAFHYVQLGTAYRSVLSLLHPTPAPILLLPGLKLRVSVPPTQGPPACAR